MPPKAITFIVPGEAQAAGSTTRGGTAAQSAEADVKGRIKQSVRVAAAQRAGAGGEVAVVAVPGKGRRPCS